MDGKLKESWVMTIAYQHLNFQSSIFNIQLLLRLSLGLSYPLVWETHNLFSYREGDD